MFFQFSPVRREVKRNVVSKENESEKVEILSLAPFTPNPKLFFEGVQVGSTVSRKLLIENPTSHDVNLFITSHIPSQLDVKISPEQIMIEKKSGAIIELTWNPLSEEFSRHMITIGDGKRIHRDVPVAFTSVLPKKSKNGTKQKKRPQQSSGTKKTETAPKKSSPTKKYYSTKPPYISPKRYSMPKTYSPTKKYSPPMKLSYTVQSASPVIKPQTIYPSVDYAKIRTSTFKENKENIPFSVLNVSCESNIFVSPSSATFRLDYLQPAERRETYIVNSKKDVSLTDSVFNDSLENVSPDLSPRVEVDKQSIHARDKIQPLGMSNQDNLSPNITEYVQKRLANGSVDCNFEHKLMQMESFCFTPLSTPLKQNHDFSPALSSTIKRNLSGKGTTETIHVTQQFTLGNNTFELTPKSPNISSETYVKSNISTETYVKGNSSFETYIKSNVSGGTFTKDTSVGDIANLTVSPVSSRIATSPNIFKTSTDNTQSLMSLRGENARQVIEANLWSGMRNEPLSCIKEESYIHQSMQETEHSNSNRSFMKRKSDLNFTFTPPKRPNVRCSPKDWSKSGGAAIRITKRTSGLNLKKFLNVNSPKLEEENSNVTVVVTKQDTHQVIIQNPYLLAATNLADPFMTPHLYVDEEWLDQQQVDFKKWLNALLTPPVELDSEEHLVDVAKVWQECKKKEVEVAPTKESVSSKYLVNHKLNSLRRSAQNLFRSKEMSSVLAKVVLAVETGKLMIRDDKDIHLNLALKSEIMSMLLSYNPLWLRVGLETIYNEIIPLRSNSDVVGLSTFITNRVLKDPYLLKKHKLVYSSTYIGEFKKFFLKKFLVLVYFLDQAKNRKLIPHDPCLFCRNSSIKESREMLTKLAREMLAAIGDITKYLKYTGYVVSHVQTYIHEFDYAVNNLGVDLRDGVRLTKVMEVILMQDNLTANLRVPAISRLQKVHNMKIVFSSLEKANYQILYDISPKDIVDGHKEKTLSFLWQIVYKFQAPLMVKSATTIQTWFRSLPVVLKRRKLERMRLRRQKATTKIQTWYRRLKLVEKLEHFRMILEKYLSFVKSEKAAIKIQSYYRMYHCRKLYTIQYNTVINIQRFAKGWLVRNVRRHQIKKVLIIQSYVRMYLARKRYLQLKKAASVIQAKYRAKKKMEAARTSYVRQKSAAIVIQTWIRTIKSSKIDKYEYQKLRTATTYVQRRFRANILCKSERKRYLEIRSATLCIQTWYRSIISMRICRRQFITMKTSVTIIEQRYIAQKAMQIERRKYQDIRKACVIIQQCYKAYAAMKLQRRTYLELKTVTVTVQNRYRANQASKKERRHFEALQSAAVFVQRTFRANRAMKIEYRNYRELREAAVKIQVWFRAAMEMRRCRTYYVSLKYAVCIFEDRYEAKKLMERNRQYYNKLKVASVTLQRKYRALICMREARTAYLRLKYATVFVQRRFIANKTAQLQRTAFVRLKQAAIVIQCRFRAQIKMRECRKHYLKLRCTTLMLQRQYRANRLMKSTRNYYQNLLKYTLIIQRRFRAIKAMLKRRNDYLKLKTAAVTIQQRWRAQIKARDCRKQYLKLRYTTVMLQRQYRANRLMKSTRNYYQNLLKYTLSIQRRFRANKAMLKQRSDYLKLKMAAVTIQRRFRAQIKTKECRKQYLKLRCTTLMLQRQYRANCLMKSIRNYYQNLLKYSLIIQRRFRANKAMLKQRSDYLRLKMVAVNIQRRFRAQIKMRVCRKQYLKLRYAAVMFQRQYRANRLMKSTRNYYQSLLKYTLIIQRRFRANKVMLKRRSDYLRLKTAAVTIQRRWRAQKLMKPAVERYTLLKYYTIKIQRRFRANQLMKRQRECFIKQRCSATVIQRFYRGYTSTKQLRLEFNAKRKAALELQRFIRGYLIRSKYAYYFTEEEKAKRRIERMERAAAIKIQALWRGHRSRSLDSTKMIDIRQRVKKATLNVESQNILGSRCKVALQVLVKDSTTVASVNKALEDLDYITRHCGSICEGVAPFLPEQMYLMIKTTNRSLPEMTACIFSVKILINICKHNPTRPYSFFPEYIDNIVTVMMHWCDKEAQLFPSMCTLLWLFAHTPEWRDFIRRLPNIEQRFHKIQSQVLRKKGMVRKAGVKGYSVFAPYKNLPLPLLVPDWGLTYKHKPYVFVNSIHAFSSLLCILNL